jgi:dTDP-4-dehydrorhamnose reductase
VKVMVTGACGMLGHSLVPRLEEAGAEVIAVRHPQDTVELPAPREPGRRRETRSIDITDGAALAAAAGETRPDWVVHLAAWTDVDGCEADPDRAFLVNGLGSRNAALAAAAVNAPVLAMSTDYVFDGSAGTPRREHDPLLPLGVYGRSKLAGELGVREVNPRHVVVRTSWLYGKGGRNFVDTIVARARAGDPPRVVDDQHGCPTYAPDLSEALLALVESRQFGTYHVTGTGECTWHEFAVAACELAGVKADVAAISSTELSRPAKRPAYSVLHNGWYEHVTGRRMPHWRDALRRYLESQA